MRRFPFTKRTIEALRPHDQDSPSREAEYTDMESSGLHLRVSKGGRKFFQHGYRYMGRKKCITLGEFPHVSVQEARQKVSEHKTVDPLFPILPITASMLSIACSGPRRVFADSQ